MSKNGQKHILILGEYSTGKTTYGAQLYERLRVGQEALRLHSVPKDLSPFSDALRRLAQGTTPEHTSYSTYHEIALTVSTPQQQVVELAWPDYGGEQITHILDKRQVNSAWTQRLTESDGWLLFIRLSWLRIYDDFLSTSALVNTAPSADKEQNKPEQLWSSAAALVELLQMFLYIKGLGTLERVVSPTLLILLSCWDEMDKDAQEQLPADLLQRTLPLLYTFIQTVWQHGRFSIWGLSSTGKRLDDEQANEDYKDYGPQEFGYVIQPDGIRKNDLTLPLLKLME